MMNWMVAMMFVFGLLMGSSSVSNVYAQTVDELRKEFERKLSELRQEFEKKLKEAVEREVAKVREEKIRQEVKSTVKKELEAQAPQATLGPAPMPPAARTPALGLFLNVDFQAINFWGVETPFAALRGAGGGTPVGHWKTVDVDRDFSARPTLGYYLPNGAGILSANFFHVDTTGTNSFSPGVRIIGPGNPGPFDNESIFAAIARNNVEANQVDLQYQYPIQLTKGFSLTPEFGLRGMFFNNRVKIDYFDSGNSLAFTKTFKSKSQAGGPKLGLEGAWELIRDLSLSVKGSAGYLLGTNRASRACVGTSECINPDRTEALIDDSRGFPFVEGDFSINYHTPWKGLSASLGYRLASFFEMTTRQRDIPAFSPRQDVFEQRNLTYDSIHFRLQYLW